MSFGTTGLSVRIQQIGRVEILKPVLSTSLNSYQLCFVRALAWKIYASFSGTLIEDGDKSETTISEQGLNGPHLTLAISDIVIVCDKLDTGYNDPLLACMYIDRSLRSSSQTVQLLSRLNRRHKGTSPFKKRDYLLGVSTKLHFCYSEKTNSNCGFCKPSSSNSSQLCGLLEGNSSS